MRANASGVLLLIAANILGCSSGETIIVPAATTPPPSEPAQVDTPDAGPATPDAGPPFVPTFPRVENAGGVVIKTPRVVPIVFKDDPLIANITKFTENMAKSSYFAAAGKEYGVGALTAGTTIVVDTAPPATISADEIEVWLAERLSGTTPAFGAPDENTLYAVFYPKGVTITMSADAMGQSCDGYGGFHSEIRAENKHVGYAVLPRCAGIDDLTVSASHEFFEWATDPFPMSGPAYAVVDAEHWAWQATMYGELGDLCTFTDREYIKPTDLGFTVQRQWSNAVSAKGSFPCIPDGATRKYFQAIPRVEDEVEAFDYGSRESLQYVKTKVLKLAPGETRSIDVFIHASEPMDAVQLKAMTLDEAYRRPSTSGFKVAFAQDTAKSGESVQLKVTAPKKQSTDFLFLYSRANEDYFMWSMVVTTESRVYPPGTDTTGLISRGVAQAQAQKKNARRAWSAPQRRAAMKAGFTGRN